MNEFRVSADCWARLEAWVAAHPRPADEPQYLAGLAFIVGAEVERALLELCWKELRKIGELCRQ